MTTINRNSEHLRQVVQTLESSHSPLDTEQWEALVEGWFRLAIDPGTPFDDAVRLLAKCLHRDGSNPKFAYHLGRLFYTRGRLSEATKWIRTACYLSPTSHRIWSHACLLHWELNEQYANSSKHEPDSLRKRAKAIADKIQNGEEPDDACLVDFVPEESLAEKERRERAGVHNRSTPETENKSNGRPSGSSANGRWRQTRRLLDANRLRWSGIRDLVVEDGLQGEARQSIVRGLMQQLQDVASDSRRRRGGFAAFAILAAQWVLSGYPTQTIRRLLGDLDLSESEQSLPSVRMITCLCDIYEADEPEDLVRLSDAAASGELPLLMIALIHRRRILWRPMESKDLSAYRRARHVLANMKLADEQRHDLEHPAADAAARLERLTAQQVGDPPRAIDDWIPEPPDGSAREEDDRLAGAAPEQVLESLEGALSVFDRVKRELLEILRQQIVPDASSDDPDEAGQAAANLAVLQELLQILQQAEEKCSQRLIQLNALCEEIGAESAPHDFPARTEQLKAGLATLTSLGTARRLVKRAESRLSAADSQGQLPPKEPTPEVDEKRSSVVAALASLDAPAPAGSDPTALLEQLETAAEELDAVRLTTIESVRGDILDATQSDDPARQSQAAADVTVVTEILQLLEQVGHLGTQRFADLLDAMRSQGQAQLPPMLTERSEELKARLTSLGSLGSAKRQLKKVVSRLAVARNGMDLPVAKPADAVVNARDRIVGWIGKLDPSQERAESGEQDTLGEILLLLERVAEQLNTAKRGATEWLHNNVLADAESDELARIAQADADLNVIREIFALLERAEKAGLEKLSTLHSMLADLANREGPDNLAERLTELKGCFNSLTSFGTAKRHMRRAASRVSATSVGKELPAADPSSAIAEARNEIGTALSDLQRTNGVCEMKEPEAAPVAAPVQPAIPDEGERQRELGPVERLALAVRKADQAFDALFDQAESSFAGYPDWVRASPPLRDLAKAVRERRAELLFRRGRRAEARQIWNALFRSDVHHVAACKNLAVCDTWSADTAGALASWRLYAQQLYALAVSAGSVRTLAAERKALHRSAGQAYAVQSLSEKLDVEWDSKVDPDESLAFIANGHRVKSFVDHKLLEFVNVQLAYRSPALVLGIARDDSTEVREAAAEAMMEFAREACAAFPEESGEAFMKLVQERVQAAVKSLSEEHKDVKENRHPRDPFYVEEREQHLQLLAEAAEMKYKLYRMAVANREFVTRMATVDFLDQLRRLDRLPLTLSDQFAKPIVAPLGMQPNELQTLIGLLAQRLCSDLLEFLFEDAENAEQEKRQDDQYERLTSHWVHREAFKDLLPMVDNPGEHYPRQFAQQIELLRNMDEVGRARIPDELLDVMRGFHRRYPRLTGVARDLADLLLKADCSQEALDVLDQTSRDGCNEDGRKLCAHYALHVRIRLASENEEFDEAIRCTQELVDEDCQNPVHVTNLISFYSSLARKTGDDPGFDDLRQTVEAWLTRALEFIVNWEPSEQTRECPLEEESLKQIEQQLEEGILSGNLNCAIHNYNKGGEAAQEQDWDKMAQRFESARKFAEYVLEHAGEDHAELVDSARNVIDSINSIEEQVET